MNVLIALTYYRPHYSGLTIYTERLAQALAERGHQVTVLTSRFDRRFPGETVENGVRIIRPWVMMRVSKGVIMPGMAFAAWKLLQKADVVNLHVPQLDAAPIAILSRLAKKPTVLTYHCDLRLPSGMIHTIANQVSHLANHISARSASAIVTNTQDYAENSPFLKNYLSSVRVIPPPVVLDPFTSEDVIRFRERFNILPGQKIIGMAARLATEKGVEYLLQAMPAVIKKYPDARVLFVGQYQNVLGEEMYAQKLAPAIQSLGAHWTFLGLLSPVELSVFFHECDVTVLPSINATESFGMVQVEAMICGTPVVSSNLPGVRQPVLSTGMGKIVPPRNVEQLTDAIIEILDHRQMFCGDSLGIAHQYSPSTIAEEYESLFKELTGSR